MKPSLALAALVLGLAVLLSLLVRDVGHGRSSPARGAAEPRPPAQAATRHASAEEAGAPARTEGRAPRASMREVALPALEEASPEAGTLVTGAILDADAGPVPGAQVRALFVHADQRTPLGAATSGVDGAYRIEAPGLRELTPFQRSLGWVRVTVDAAGFRPASRRVAPASTAASASLRVDVVLSRGPTVSGRVLAPSGAPVARASVVVTLAGGGRTAPETTGEDGRFRMPLHGPLARILASAPGVGVVERLFPSAAESLEVDSLDVGDLVLEAGSLAEGWLVCPDGGGLAGVALALRAEGGRRHETHSETAADGFFRFMGLAAGEYALSLADSGYDLGPVVTDRPGERHVLDVRAVRVSVLDASGTPVPDVQVRAFPEGEDIGSDRYRNVPYTRIGVTRGADGSCVLRLSGEKEFVLSTEVIGGAFAERFLGRRASCSTEVTLVLGGEVRAGLALDVRAPDGAACASYEVELLSPRTGELRYYLDAEEVDARADPADRVELEPGRYELLLTPVGEAARYLLPESTSVTLAAGEPTARRFDLTAGGHLRARIDLGAEAVGARVRARLLAADGELRSLLTDTSVQGVSAFFAGGRWGDAERPAPPGAYTLELLAAGFRSRALEVELRAGETTSVEVALDPY